MHQIIYLILSLFAIAFLGAVMYWREFKEAQDRRDFAYEYQNRFVAFADDYMGSRRIGNDYTLLIQNALLIQQRMGRLGKMHFKPPFANGYIPNYEIITNTMSKFRSGVVHEAEIGYADDTLLHYIKRSDVNLEQSENNLKNPILWLRQGFRLLVGFPIYLLDWFGLLSKNTTQRIVTNSIFQFFSNLVALTAFASSIVTIIVGWDKVVAFIHKLFTH